MHDDARQIEKIIRTVLLILLIAYVLYVLWYTVFSRDYSEARKTFEGELFWSIRAALKDPGGAMTKEVLYNCIMLIPMGFALAWVLSPWVTDDKAGMDGIKLFAVTTLCGFLLTSTIEILQLTMKRGLFEFDDIIYNTLGTMIGYLLYRLSRCIIEKIHAKALAKKVHD